MSPLEDDEGIETGRAGPLELVVLALNQTGATGVGSVAIDETREPRG
jgi:hypothetical protein